jgi:hypothetical protein
VLGIVVLLLPTIFLLHFGTVLTVSYIFVFDLFYQHADDYYKCR